MTRLPGIGQAMECYTDADLFLPHGGFVQPVGQADAPNVAPLTCALCTQEIMEELLGRLNAEFDESEGWIRIVDADWMADDLRLSLSVLFYEDAEPELWEVSCFGVAEESLSSKGVETLSISSESPLLKIFTEPEVELMFSENACVPAFLLGVVCTSCVEILGRAEYIQRFLNQASTVGGIVNSRYGQLGRFPESIAARIIDALNGQPIRIKALPGRMPKRWNGTEFISYPALKALEIGKSYVIAEQFSAVRA